MTRHPHCVRNCVRLSLAGVAAVFLTLAGPPAATAQEQLGSKADVDEPFFLGAARFAKLRDGEAQPDPAKDKALIEVAAKYHVYHLTWKTYRDDIKSSESGLPKLRKDLNDLMTAPATQSGKNKEFMKLLAHELIGCFKQVLALKFEENHQAVTHGALMLQALAKCRQAEVHDFLMEIARTPADPADRSTPRNFIRMCAVRALGEFNNPHWAGVDDKGNPQAEKAKLQRDKDRLDFLANNYIIRPYPPEGSDAEHREAWIYARREGIKALAQVQVPALANDKGKITGPAAFYLMYLANGGALPDGPPLTMSERLEAVIGLCQLKAGETPGYNTELAVYIIAGCLADMTEEYNQDHLYFSVPPKSKDDPKRQPKLPWTNYAQRLEVALDVLAANVPKDSAAGKKLAALLEPKNGPLLPALKQVKDRAKVSNPQLVINAARGLVPPSMEVYQGNKDWVLKAPAK
jgi:hypothetical protein